MTIETTKTTKTCADCRYAGTFKRPRIAEATGFDDQLMFEDADQDETVYMCRAEKPRRSEDGLSSTTVLYGESCEPAPHAGKEIGLVPVTCVAWAAVVPTPRNRLDELDAMIAARNARVKEKE